MDVFLWVHECGLICARVCIWWGVGGGGEWMGMCGCARKRFGMCTCVC